MMFVPKSLLLFSCFTSALYLQFVFSCSSSSRFRDPLDCFLISCGESKPVELEDGRVFQPDSANPNVSLTPNSSHIVVSSSPDTILGLPKIYTSAMVFFNNSSYTITTRQIGRHWLRLHFYPVNNTRFDLHSALFTITANGITLVHGGFASLFRKNKSYPLVKEYAIQVGTSSSSSSSRLGKLVLALSPWDGSVAFINGIEVLSMPDRQFGSSLVGIPSEPSHEIPSQVAFETVYRIDMGGNPGSTMLKSDPLWRRWESDEKYLVNVASARNVSVDPSLVKYPSGVSPEIAPRWVYATAQEMADAHVNDQRFNVSWSFKVERWFKYFIRMHFCDIISERLEDLIFNVYINNQSALRSFDLSRRTRELSTAYFVDFFTNGSSDRILVQVGPSSLESFTPNAILNGLEIMKTSNPSGSLDGKFSASPVDPKKSESSHMAVVIFSCLLGGFIVLVSLISLAIFLFFRHKEEEKPQCSPRECRSPLCTQTAGPEMTVSTNPSFGSTTTASVGLGQILSISEIREATRNFDKRLLLGAGGFGKVYRGVLENGLVVAVKRGNPRSQQGLLEFKTEIEMLSKLRHRHLVSLIGYCEEFNEMILVYEFMAGGPLRKQLYGSKLPPLSWKQRIEICIGAAKGLHYLHTGAAECIIHRDVKTTNILLDEKLEAKVADFGLSKFGPALDQTHVSTVVKGSFGYLDPEYFRRQQLTEKSDVYSFGVVLIEVLCARPAINPTLPREQVNIAEWALNWQRQGRLDQILDPRLAGTVNLDSLRKFGETAEKCLAENGNERPSMGDVLWNLEYALQLHEASTHGNGVNENSATRISDIPEWIIPRVEHDDDIETVSDDQPGSSSITTNRVFSQILDPKGR